MFVKTVINTRMLLDIPAPATNQDKGGFYSYDAE